MYHKTLPFTTGLMDNWYATHSLMRTIEGLNKIYDCLLKDNRLVAEGQQQSHQRVESLSWSDLEQQAGKVVHVKDFPKDHQLKRFWLMRSTQRTDDVVTNDQTQNSVDAVQQVCAIR